MIDKAGAFCYPILKTAASPREYQRDNELFRHKFYIFGKNIPTAEPQRAQSLFLGVSLRPLRLERSGR